MPVTSAATAAVKLRLKQEGYRAKWAYKDSYRADKWAHRDEVREMKRARRELVKARRAERKAAREQKRRMFDAEKIATTMSESENAVASESAAGKKIHVNK